MTKNERNKIARAMEDYADALAGRPTRGERIAGCLLVLGGLGAVVLVITVIVIATLRVIWAL